MKVGPDLRFVEFRYPACAESGHVGRVSRYLPVLLLFCSIPSAVAQGPYNVALGFGSAQVPSNGLGIENANSINAFGSCVPSVLDPTCERNPALGRFFMGFDGDALLNRRLGFGAELFFQPAKGNYAPLQYRQLFYDFNALYEPIAKPKLHSVVRLTAGIGGAHTGFSFSSTSCVGVAVCSTEVLPVGSANHFLLHAGVGVQVFLSHSVFIRPQFDYRYVPGFTDQFGRNSVLQWSVWLGYNFGTF